MEGQKILDICPWSFEKQLIIMKEFEGELIPKDIVMKWSPFWIQIFNLPLKSRTKEMVEQSGRNWERCWKWTTQTQGSNGGSAFRYKSVLMSRRSSFVGSK